MLFLFRKHVQGAGACRHNRIQDTLLQPEFTAVIITLLLKLWWPTCLPSPCTFLTHGQKNTHTSTWPSKHSNRYPDYPPRTAHIVACATGLRKRKTASKEGQDVSIGKSIKKNHLQALHKVIEDAAGMLGMPPHLIKVQNKERRWQGNLSHTKQR